MRKVLSLGAFVLVAFLALFVGATPAAAALITFDGGIASGDDNYTEDGFTIDGNGFASYGDYYGAGNNVIHTHWFCGACEVKVTKDGGGDFDLNYFILTSNTVNGGGAASGTENSYIHAWDATSIVYSQLLPSGDWGFPATSIVLGAQFDNIYAFSFTSTNAFCFGMDEFYIDEEGPGDPPVVPEPATLALLGVGLGLRQIARRRRKAAR